MRTILPHLLLGLLIFSPLPALAHKDRIEPPHTLTTGFKTGETVAFALSGVTVTAITLRVGKATYRVPRSKCAKLLNIRFETVSFLWNGSFSSAGKADYFYLRFNMGTERARTFGELPQVQLLFRKGNFAEATTTKKIGNDVWQDFEL